MMAESYKKIGNDEVRDVAIGNGGRGISRRVVQPLWAEKMMTSCETMTSSEETTRVNSRWKNISFQ